MGTSVGKEVPMTAHCQMPDVCVTRWMPVDGSAKDFDLDSLEPEFTGWLDVHLRIDLICRSTVGLTCPGLIRAGMARDG